MKENIKESNEFWKDIIYKDGKLNEEQVLKELADYYFLMKQVPSIYCHITGGMLSKLNYTADTLISAADDYQQELFNEWVKGMKDQDD